MSKNVIWYIVALIADAVLIWFDWFTKRLAAAKLLYAPFPIIKDVFELELLTNQGAAFGVFEGGRWVFVLLSSAIVVGVVWFFVKFPFKNCRVWYRLALILVAAGGVGNLVDRVLRGYVVDFFYFKLINFPVFNMADVYVVCGCFLFVVLIAFFPDKSEEMFEV